QERGLSTLELVGSDGRVLACGHDPARWGESDTEALARARRWEKQPLLIEEQVLEGGKLERRLAVETARWARLEGGAVLVIAGKRLDEEGFLNPLKLPGLEVSLVPMTNEALPERPRYPSDVLPLAGADRVVRAGIVLSVVKTDLRSALEKAVTL